MVLLGMINVALKLLGGSLIWKDYCFFQFPEENGIRLFKLLMRQTGITCLLTECNAKSDKTHIIFLPKCLILMQ